jgi:hypothetical protein
MRFRGWMGVTNASRLSSLSRFCGKLDSASSEEMACAWWERRCAHEVLGYSSMVTLRFVFIGGMALWAKLRVVQEHCHSSLHQ